MAGPSFQQHQSLKQSQTLAPQMQQSLQILQAPALELRSLIAQELAENPTLEDETQDISLEEEGLDKDKDDDFDEEFSQLSALDDEWRDYMAQSRKSSARSASDEERRQFMMDSIVRQETLQEHLLEQLSTESIDKRTRELVEMLIGSLDDNGFLQTELDELSLINGMPVVELEKAKKVLQSFDPAGVGATNLSECLMIQLERQGKKHSLEYRIVANCIDDLAKHRFPQIARKLAVPVEEVSRAAEIIARLDPKPGRIFETGTNTYVTPDVYVEKDESGEFQIVINNEQIPRLRISNTYKDLMATRGDERDVRGYIRDKIRNGKMLIRSIQQRQDTIRRISEELVGRQKEFMEKGKSGLKPMTMAQVSEAVGVHETTVSRAISGKYISTPYGVFEMKYFFTTGYQTESGESMSNTSVKEAIADVVDDEDPRKPLSDQGIVEKLAENGVKIARRTVAKYREELGILPSHMRKSY